MKLSTVRGIGPKTAALALAVAMAPISFVSAAVVLGQTASPGTKIDGLSVPSGTTLLSPSRVETGSRGGVVHLANGRVVAMGEESAARIEATDSGEIQLSVLSGRLAFTDDAGELTTVAADKRVLFGVEGSAIQRAGNPSADEDVQEERLCRLRDSTPERFEICSDRSQTEGEDCAWELLTVPGREVGQHLDVDSVFACKDRNSLGLDCDCEAKGAAIGWWVAGGIGAATAIGIISTKDDNEQIASPTTP